MRHLAEQAASCDQFSVQKNEGDDSMNSSGFVPIRVPVSEERDECIAELLHFMPNLSKYQKCCV